MVSDVLTAIILFLMAVLVIYPTTRLIQASWQSRQRRQAQRDDGGRRR